MGLLLQLEQSVRLQYYSYFFFRTQREVRDVQIVSYPGPNKYEVVDQLVHPSICPYTSAFKSTSARNEFARPKQVAMTAQSVLIRGVANILCSVSKWAGESVKKLAGSHYYMVHYNNYTLSQCRDQDQQTIHLTRS